MESLVIGSDGLRLVGGGVVGLALDREQDAVQAMRGVGNAPHLHVDAEDVERRVKQMQQARVIGVLDVFQIQLPV